MYHWRNRNIKRKQEKEKSPKSGLGGVLNFSLNVTEIPQLTCESNDYDDGQVGWTVLDAIMNYDLVRSQVTILLGKVIPLYPKIHSVFSQMTFTTSFLFCFPYYYFAYVFIHINTIVLLQFHSFYKQIPIIITVFFLSLIPEMKR